MREIRGNLFKPQSYEPSIGRPDALVILTNGFVKGNGEAVMGRGCAKEASQMDKELPRILGQKVLREGNFPYILRKREGKIALVSFPVKPCSAIIQKKEDLDKVVPHMRDKFKVGSKVPGWACVADIEIIQSSCKALSQIASNNNWSKVVIPRMGCGAGRLEWSNVKESTKDLLDDRFYVITFPERRV